MSFHPGAAAGFPRAILVPPVEPPEEVDPLAWALLAAFQTTSNTPAEGVDITIGGATGRTYLVAVIGQVNSGLGSASMPKVFLALHGAAAVEMRYCLCAGLASNAPNMQYVGLHEVTGATNVTATIVPAIPSGTMSRSVGLYRIDAGNAKVVGLCSDEKAGTAPLSVAVPGGDQQLGVGFAFQRIDTPTFSLTPTTLENIDQVGSLNTGHFGIVASGDNVSPTLSATASPAGTLNGLGVASFGRMAAPLVDHVLVRGDRTNTSTETIKLGTAATNRKVVLLLGTAGTSNLSHRINAAKITVDGTDYDLVDQGSSTGATGNRYVVQAFDGDVPAGAEGLLTLTRNSNFTAAWITNVFVAVFYGATLTNVYGGTVSGSVSHGAGDHLISLIHATGKYAHEAVLANRLARMPLSLATTQNSTLEAEPEIAASAGSTATNVPAIGLNPRVFAAAYAGSLTP